MQVSSRSSVSDFCQAAIVLPSRLVIASVGGAQRACSETTLANYTAVLEPQHHCRSDGDGELEEPDASAQTQVNRTKHLRVIPSLAPPVSIWRR